MLLQADDIDKHVCGESDMDMIYYLQVVCTDLLKSEINDS